MKQTYVSTNPLKQTPHIVAFLDFLNASETMRSAKKSDEFLQNLHTIYNDIIALMTEKELSGEGNVKIRIFSDNIVIAKETADYFDRNAIFEVFSYSCFFQAYALSYGLPVRGGISIGEFYMDETFVFGEGLVKAYEKENTQAIYPRIIVDKAIFKGVSIRGVKDYWGTFANMLEVDSDGELFLNFISPFLHPEDIESSVEYLTKAQKSIIMLYERGRSNDKARQKLLWLFNKYNELCKKYGYAEQIMKHNENYEPDIPSLQYVSDNDIDSIVREVCESFDLDDKTMEADA